MRIKLSKLKLKIQRYKRIRLNRRIKGLKKASRQPLAVPIFTFFVFLSVAGIIFVIANSKHNDNHRPAPYVVIISHDGVKQVVPSIEPTVGTLLKKLKIGIHPGDRVEPSLATRINQDKFRINIYRALPVQIVDGSNIVNTFSAATTPRAIAQGAGLSLYSEDLLTSAETTNFTSTGALGQVITVKPSVPINLILYGTPIVTRSHSDTVQEMLAEKHIILKNGDTVMPGLTASITPGETIYILHAGETVITATQPIPEPVQYVNDATLSVGTSAVRQQGSPGQLLITYFVNTVTGAKTQLQSVQLSTPVTEIVARGTAPVNSSLSEWLSALRDCESGGNYGDDTGNGYYGAYQFSEGTWERDGYSGLPSDAAPSTQDSAIVKNTNASSGGLATQNPGCYERTGISAFPPS
jgi:uncharacterized protein YabE (DUF348 family)